MKRLLTALFVCLFAMTFVFAGGSSEESTTGETGDTELVIYSAASEAEAEALAEAFNQIYPEIDITIISAGSGDIVTRVTTEWPKPEGDVILLLATENINTLYDKLEPYKSVNHDSIDPANIDPQSPDNPKYYATSMPLQAIMYNTNLLSTEDAPKSWKDLADPKYKGEIVLANPASSGSAYAQLYMMNKLYGMDFVKEVAANTTYVASSTSGPDSVARGEYAITVTGEANIANKLAAGDPVAYVLPEEGTGRRIEGSAIIANAKHPDAAKKFIDFMTSKEGFEVVRGINRRPASAEIAGPEGLPSLSEMTFFEYDDTEAKNLKAELVEQFNTFI